MSVFHAVLGAARAVPPLTPQQDAPDGLSLRRLLSDLPADPASLFAIGLMVLCVGAVLWFGRAQQPPATKDEGDE